LTPLTSSLICGVDWTVPCGWNFYYEADCDVLD
jgi:hypothetical protein